MIYVRKANGGKEVFNEDKVRSSIKRARIPETVQSRVLEHVKSKLYDDITTREIYHHITEFLEKTEEPYARSRYSLKNSLMALGPSGYPFEDYIAAVLESEGYTIAIRQMLLGQCVNHEIDVVATKNKTKVMVEAKFHNTLGARSDVQVALYTKARFDDIKTKHTFDEAWLVTNTKVTSDAVAYATCVGMKILSWSYPENESLREIIEKKNLYPITVLTSLSNAQKAQLLQNHVVMCSDIYKDNSVLSHLSLSEDEKKRVIQETAYICSS